MPGSAVGSILKELVAGGLAENVTEQTPEVVRARWADGGEGCPRQRQCDNLELSNSPWLPCLQGEVKTLSMCLHLGQRTTFPGKSEPPHSRYYGPPPPSGLDRQAFGTVACIFCGPGI